MQKLLQGGAEGESIPARDSPTRASQIDEIRKYQGPLNFPHTYQTSVHNFPRFSDLRICTPVCRNSTVKLWVKTAFYKLKKIRRILLVGAWRFELQTSCAQGRRATRLRYAPTRAAPFHSKAHPRSAATPIPSYAVRLAPVTSSTIPPTNASPPSIGGIGICSWVSFVA